MAPKKEFGPGVNDHEAGSSRQIVPTAFLMAPPVAEHEHIYITVVLAQTFWEAGAPMPWGNIHLPHGWHLIPYRVSVPPIPTTVRARLGEIQPRPALAGLPGGPGVRGEESLLGHVVRGGASYASAHVLQLGDAEASRAASHAGEEGRPPPRWPLHR
jgi:hypothetical protein